MQVEEPVLLAERPGFGGDLPDRLPHRVGLCLIVSTNEPAKSSDDLRSGYHRKPQTDCRGHTITTQLVAL